MPQEAIHVLILAINDERTPVEIEESGNFPKSIRRINVVRIDPDNDFARSVGHRLVDALRLPAVRSRIKGEHLGMMLLKLLEDLNCSIFGSTVRHKDLQAWIILGHNTLDRFLDELSLVIRGHHRRDGGKLFNREFP